jgi:hypothetical protein
MDLSGSTRVAPYKYVKRCYDFLRLMVSSGDSIKINGMKLVFIFLQNREIS